MESKPVGGSSRTLSDIELELLYTYLNFVNEAAKMEEDLWRQALCHSPRSTPPSTKS